MKKPIIKCPYCGREYMAAEIFLPDYFLGHPTNIIKGFDGNILSYDGEDMDLKEEYICDDCGKKFKVEASVNFKTELVKDIFDTDEYVSEEN